MARFRLRGWPVFVHWSFPAFGVLVAFFLKDGSLATVASAVAAYTLLVLVHEFGHAFFAVRAGSKVHALVITGGGGFCYADLPDSRHEVLLFYAGGLLAQLVLFVCTIATIALLGSPSSTALGCFSFVFTFVNGLLLLSNAIPYGSNDGALLLSAIAARRAKG